MPGSGPEYSCAMPGSGPPWDTTSVVSEMSLPPPPNTNPAAPVGRGRTELLCSLLRLALLRRQNHVTAPVTMAQKATTPTPMPVFAPTLRSEFSSARLTPLAVGVTMESAQCAAPETCVQLCRMPQQPPPRLAGQLIWLVVQPAGTGKTRGLDVVDGLTVEMH